MPQLDLFKLTGNGYHEGLEQRHVIICWINVQIKALCNSVSGQCYNVIKRVLAANGSLQKVVVNDPSVVASREHGWWTQPNHSIIFPAQIDSQQVTTNMKVAHCVMQLQIVRWASIWWGFNAQEGLATV